MYENVRYEVADGVATVTLHRPERLNAYTPAMGEEAYDAFARARDDESVRVIVWTGAGRGFCAGVDLEHLKAHRAGGDASGGPRLGEEAFLRKLPLEIPALPKPVIAAINGAAMGVGVTMTLPCDLRFVAAGAKLGLPFVRLGLLPGLGSTHWLPRLVGLARAQELVLTGRTFLAEEAAAMGLANAVLPGEKLLPHVHEVARAICASPPEVIAAAKRALQRGASLGPAEAMAHEQEASAALRRPRG